MPLYAMVTLQVRARLTSEEKEFSLHMLTTAVAHLSWMRWMQQLRNASSTGSEHLPHISNAGGSPILNLLKVVSNCPSNGMEYINSVHGIFDSHTMKGLSPM